MHVVVFQYRLRALVLGIMDEDGEGPESRELRAFGYVLSLLLSPLSISFSCLWWDSRIQESTMYATGRDCSTT